MAATMRTGWLFSLLLLSGTRARAESNRCQLSGAPWLEARVGDGKLATKAIDARIGETIDVFVAQPARLDDKVVVLGESGKGRVPFTACGDGAVKLAWRRIEPMMEHTTTKAPNITAKIYANAVVFGAKHGKWLGYDRLEYVETPLDGDHGVLKVIEARPSKGVGIPDRDAGRAVLGVMRLAATVTIGKDTRSTPGIETADKDGQIGETVFRYTFRSGDQFLGWLSSFFNVPYLFGSAGFGKASQAERYIGADCADVLVAALRRTGYRMEFSSVAGLVGSLTQVAGPIELRECVEGRACKPTALRFGVDVQPGDLLAIGYVAAEELPRKWDHIVAVVEDSGPDGKPDGVLGPDDLMADSGDRLGLRILPLAHQGWIQLAVLRPQKTRQR